MQPLKTLLDSPAVNVFLGTLPMLGAIVWGLLQNDRRLATIEKHMDSMEQRSDHKFERVEARLDSIDIKIAVMSERLVKVETKLEGGQLVRTTR